MVFELDPDRPTIPGIARILLWLGVLSLIATVVLMLIAFSKLPWVNQTLAMGGAVGSFMFALIMIGQAKTLELMAVVSARLKSRFAIEQTLAAKNAAAAAPGEPKLPSVAKQAPARVITIPEAVAREQGITRNPEPRDFG